MTLFLAALVAFIGMHVGVAATGLRAALVRAVGEWPYRGGFSIASAVLLAALVMTYPGARDDAANIALWAPSTASTTLGAWIALFGVAFAVAGLLSPGPTLAGFEGALARAEPATGFGRITRHPFLWGVAIWGIGHLLSNGTLTAAALFGGLAAMALQGARSIDAKTAARSADDWARYKAASSNLPFAAILQGRNRLALGETGWRAAVGLGVAGALAWAHGAIFDVPATGLFPVS